MPKLTKPGISDLHWQSTTIRATNDVAICFFETEDQAVAHARVMPEIPRVSVYVSQVMHHGEHVRKRAARST